MTNLRFTNKEFSMTLLRKLVALLLSAGLLVGCTSTTEPVEVSSAIEDSQEMKAETDSTEQELESEVTDTDTEGVHSEQSAEPTETATDDSAGPETIGQELLKLAISKGVIDCFELLGPDFTRAANGVESIKWYCLPELNVESLQIVTATYDSVDDLETQSQIELQAIEGLQGFTHSLFRNELTTVGIFSKDEDWDSELAETLRLLWGW